MIREITPHLYAIKVRLVGNPLRELNSYVIRTPKRNLLIDTGFNQPECLQDLREGIGELGLEMDRTDILVTHYHADHSGLMDQIVAPGCRVYMGEIDKVLMEANFAGQSQWMLLKDRYREEGFPAKALEQAANNNPARRLAGKGPVELTPLKDGEILPVGELRLRCIHTPGHTPGHICLYSQEERFMVLGDHILFDITPNITAWPTLPNSLASYLESLKMIRTYDVELPLPAHRECHCTVEERVDQLLLHHERRLEDTMAIVRETPGICGYDVAGRMSWSIRAKSWEDFPLAQKWFAVGETMAHLNYLVDKGRLIRQLREGISAYYPL